MNNVRLKPPIVPGFFVGLAIFGALLVIAVFKQIDNSQWRAKFVDNYSDETCKVTNLDKSEGKYTTYSWDLNCPSVSNTRHGEISQNTYQGSFVGQEVQVFNMKNDPTSWQRTRPTLEWRDESNAKQLLVTFAIFAIAGGCILASWLNAQAQLKFLAAATIISADILDIKSAGDRFSTVSVKLRYDFEGESREQVCSTTTRSLSELYKTRKVLVAVRSGDLTEVKIIDQLNYVELVGPPNLHSPTASS